MLGLGFSATSEISALPRLERQGEVDVCMADSKVSGKLVSEKDGQSIPSMDDVVVLDEDVIMDESDPHTVI
ncbi:hypothetical protein V6N12_060914 [Hibiscus sabdariffa]|uniref:Uncharacterized protein n=1 Tax=Hibiscus sabdariffa TaxID=183260 RepID=A0ABR2DXA4_9ROSI